MDNMAQLEKNIALVQERARNEDIDWEDDERDGKVSGMHKNKSHYTYQLSISVLPGIAGHLAGPGLRRRRHQQLGSTVVGCVDGVQPAGSQRADEAEHGWQEGAWKTA